MKTFLAAALCLVLAGSLRAEVYPLPELGIAVEVPGDLSLDKDNHWGTLFRKDKMQAIRIHEKPGLSTPDAAVAEMLEARRKKPETRPNDILSVRLVKTESGLAGIAVQAGRILSLNTSATNVIHYYFKSPKGPVFCVCVYNRKGLQTLQDFDDLVLSRISIVDAAKPDKP